MSYINVRKANCKNCYRCIKNCHVKSIKYENDRIVILEDACILCGKCITTCPQKAKSIINDTVSIRRKLDDKNSRVFVSLDPSFVAAFGANYKKVPAALKKLGFEHIEETSLAASVTTQAYSKLIAENKMKNIISTACPTVNSYITKYYPELIQYMAPVMSPLEIHGKLMKREYGSDITVIFIGPCLSKLGEIDHTPYIDGMLTFTELIGLFNERRITLEDLPEEDFERSSSYSRAYPIVDGMIYDLIKNYKGETGTERAGNYDLLSVSGLANINNILDELKTGTVSNVFVEANACYGGCVHGPFMPISKSGNYKGRLDIKEYADAATAGPIKTDIDIKKEFIPEPVDVKMPTETEIRYILGRIGKYTKAQELDCGSCGYSTCREKAIAVYQGKADLYLCLPYMTDINQTMANVTLSLTPNYIIAVDENMNIKEFNVAAQRLFKTSRNDAINKKLYEFIDTSDFQNVIYNQTSIYDKKVRYDELGIVTQQTIVYAQDRNMAVAIIQDITEEEKRLEALSKMRHESLDMAQKVIDKQMTVAQQIASLLGETTAETKVTLNRLKNLVAAEEGTEQKK